MKNIIVYILLGFLGGFSLGHAQTGTSPHTKETVYKVATQDGIVSPEEKSVKVVYYDRLGRPSQELLNAQTVTGKNMMKHFEYDFMGRNAKEYLPYPTDADNLDIDSNPEGNIQSFYANYNGGTSYPYSEKVFEASPLNRLVEQSAPGEDWALPNGHTIKMDYSSNASGEVKLYEAKATWNSTLNLFDEVLIDTEKAYEPLALYKITTKDENWTAGSGFQHLIIEYTNKSGQLILKRTYDEDEPLDTYYVYDVYGNLAFVIPPKVNTSEPITAEVLNGLCYQYRYDRRNRLVEKKFPGKTWEYIIYNKVDLPVLTGPVLNPFTGDETGWLFTKYDAFGRIAYTGYLPWTDEIESSTRNGIQSTEFEGVGLDMFETPEKNSVPIPTAQNPETNLYYSNKIFPTQNFWLLTVNYYDDYRFYDIPVPGSAHFNNTDKKPFGLPTGSWVRVITRQNEAKSEISWMLYDNKYRMVLSEKRNYFGGWLKVETDYDFMGKTLVSRYNHRYSLTDPSVLFKETFEYYPNDSPKQRFHLIDNMPEETLSHNFYDSVGYLIRKELGGNGMVPILQGVDFKYNIRGWLTDINNMTGSNDPTDLFAFHINYNEVENDLDDRVRTLYNGNISETFWKSASDNTDRKYGYVYDSLNRLSRAYYQRPDMEGACEYYDEWAMYDRNGNIVYLGRNGDFDEPYMNAVAIDRISYAYYDNSNQVRAIADETQNPSGFKDDDDGISDFTDDYTYDAFGNMIADRNKGISRIVYNHLNLPLKVTFNHDPDTEIEYQYNALGQKVRKTVKSMVGSSPHSTTVEYLDGYQYKDGVLLFFPTSEGYVRATKLEGSPYNFNYVYQYKDHLGNIRMNFGWDPADAETKILKEDHYYPFGLIHKNYNPAHEDYIKEPIGPLKIGPVPAGQGEVYKYKYNGKELQDELGLNWYDYGARNYDPAIGRWMNIDPLAEKSRRFSPYVYALDNPVFFIDPDGMLASPHDWINWIGKNGQQHITYQNGITTVEQAKAAGFTTATQVFKAGEGVSKKTGETVSFKEGGKFSVDGKNLLNVADGGYTTDGGTHINKGLTGVEQTAKLAQATGDGITAVGLVTGNPILIGAGGLVSKAGLALETSNSFATEGVNQETITKNGVKIGIEIGFGALGDAGVTATRNVAGKEYVESGANVISETIIQGTATAGSKAADKISEDLIKKK